MCCFVSQLKACYLIYFLGAGRSAPSWWVLQGSYLRGRSRIERELCPSSCSAVCDRCEVLHSCSVPPLLEMWWTARQSNNILLEMWWTARQSNNILLEMWWTARQSNNILLEMWWTARQSNDILLDGLDDKRTPHYCNNFPVCLPPSFPPSILWWCKHFASCYNYLFSTRMRQQGSLLNYDMITLIDCDWAIKTITPMQPENVSECICEALHNDLQRAQPSCDQNSSWVTSEVPTSSSGQKRRPHCTVPAWFLAHVLSVSAGKKRSKIVFNDLITVCRLRSKES